MVTISVLFSIAEKELLEKQAAECETVLPNFIRIRCLMDETDIRILRRTINEQKRQLEELRVKLSFYQEQENYPETVKQLTDNPVNGLLIQMSEQQLQFLTESLDYNDPYTQTRLPNGSYTRNEREVLELEERQRPGHIHYDMVTTMVYNLLDQIEERLKEYWGYDKKDDFEEKPLIEAFDDLE